MKKLLIIALIAFVVAEDSIQFLESNSDNDIEKLTRVCYCEARGEPDNGKLAVCYTVVNRAKKSGKSVAYEATKKYQFCVYNGEMKETGPQNKCRSYARQAINRSVSDPSNGATFFYSGSKVPDWAKGRSPCAIIGGHRFYKGIAPY